MTSGTTSDRDGHYWNDQAAIALGPLLYAAAIGDRDIKDVIRWIDRQDEDEPIDILRAVGDTQALDQLEGIFKHDSRNRSTVYMSASRVLKAYRSAQKQAGDTIDLTPEAFLNGAPNTLYICPSGDDHKTLTPITLAMLDAIIGYAKALARAGKPLSPYLRILLDEAAHVAELPNLPSELAEARGHGIRYESIYHTYAQLQQRYGHDAPTVFGSSGTKIFLGSISDDATRRQVTGLLGDKPHPDQPGNRTPVASAQDLLQLPEGQALVFSGSTIPAVVSVDPYWEISELAGRYKR